MYEKKVSDITKRLDDVFSNKNFISSIERNKKNWLGLDVNFVLKNIINYINAL